MKLRICIDQDEVLASLLPEWLKRYNYDFSDSLTSEQITDWDVSKFVKQGAKNIIFDYLNDPELFDNLPVIEGSQRVVEKLSKRFDVYICSAALNASNIPPKKRWLKKHFPFLDQNKFVFTVDKGIIAAHWMIDDRPLNLEMFTPLAGTKNSRMLFDAMHNRNESRFRRMNNWREIDWYFETQVD